MSATPILQVAAAVLVLLEGVDVPLPALLAPMAERGDLAAIDRRLRVGSREARAKALAAQLTRLAIDLDRWRIA
jgi:hypothetical protein